MEASATPALNGTNGAHIGRLAEALQEEITVGYRPVIPLEALWMAGSDMPQMTLRRDIEFMQLHPIVMDSLDYYKSGISGAEFWGGRDLADPNNPNGRPISPNGRVAMFIQAQVERFWQVAVPMIQEGGYPYGWAGGEHMYREVNGMMAWSHIKTFHPNDCFVLSENYMPVGIRVKNIRDKMPINLWFATDRIPAKAVWYCHKPRFGQVYGRSQLLAAWRPWRRLAWRDGVEQVIDAAIYRAGYRGPIVRHPTEDMQTARVGVPATQADGRGMPRRAARDVARQIVEWAKAGAGFTIPSTQYSQAEGGGPKWDVEFPDHVMDVRPLIEGARYLEDQIMLGIGVPPELIRSGGTGSGYSGRSIPREAFLDGQQKVAEAMLQMFVKEVIRPLVKWNFGDVPFEISCKSLLKAQADDKIANPADNNGPEDFKRSQAARDAWARRKINEGVNRPSPGPGGSPPQSPVGTGPALSIADDRKRVLAIVRQIIATRRAE